MTGTLTENDRMFPAILDNLPGMAYRLRKDPGWTLEYVSAGALGSPDIRPTTLSAAEPWHSTT
jgi:hypothetical protein